MFVTHDYFIHEDRCRRCNLCIQICPRNAIRVPEHGSFSIDTILCNSCGECQKVCKIRAIGKKFHPHSV